MNNTRSESLAGIDIDELRYLSQIENEVRRRLQDILSGAGLSSDGVAKEVLYWLPSEFLEWYKSLFLKALQLNQEQGKGESNQRKADLGRALVDEKEYKGKRVGSGAGGKRVAGASRNGGGAWIIRDEVALGLLEDINRELVRLMHGYIKVWGKDTEKLGVIVERVMEKGKQRRVCGDCAKLMNKDWRRCPFHE